VTFFSLLVVLVAEAVKSSPCMRKMARNRHFGARWESFVPGGPAKAACWESFVPGGPSSRAAGRVICRVWSSEIVQDEFRFVTHLGEIRRWSSRM